ncbi:unnamed protein product [Caenorhabditis brenneri]
MSKCSDLQNPLKRKNGFKLIRLPGLARNEVVRSMDIDEIIKLSLCSRKMDVMIKHTKLEAKKIEFRVDINNSILQIESFNKNLNHCTPDQLKEGSKKPKRGSPIISRLIKNYYTSFQNCASILKHLQNIISFKSFWIRVNFEGMILRFFKEILTEPTLKNFDRLCLENGEIDAECLDLVMEMASSDRDLHITCKTKFPHNYYHDNAFKFRHIYYSDARPVRIEHLFSLKDAYSITLDTHRLTRPDLNKFIKFWIDSDHDMIDLLNLEMWVFEPEILFNGIVVLVGERWGLNGWHLIAANPTKQRECQIMAVIWLGTRIHLYSWNKDQPIMFGDTVVEPWAPEYEALRAMNKEKELKQELEKVDTIEKKNEITRELQNVSQELDSYNLVFRDGFYHYKPTNIPR